MVQSMERHEVSLAANLYALHFAFSARPKSRRAHPTLRISHHPKSNRALKQNIFSQRYSPLHNQTIHHPYWAWVRGVGCSHALNQPCCAVGIASIQVHTSYLSFASVLAFTYHRGIEAISTFHMRHEIKIPLQGNHTCKTVPIE